MRKFSRVLIKKDDKFLLLKETHGFWNFPGGKVEPDEVPENCAKRESLEEIGIVLHRISLLDSCVFLIDGEHWEGWFYFVHDYSNQPIAKERKTIEIQFETLNNVQFHMEIRKYLDRISSLLKELPNSERTEQGVHRT
jgi:8-oxo-dGTP diphosphatase